jgi:iron complex transport system permease protein
LKIRVVLLFTTVLLVTLFGVGLRLGNFECNFSTLYQAFTNYDASNLQHLVIVQLRLPRLLMAFLAGGSLALCGYLMQLLIGNPLAEPYTLGTANGAALGAVIAWVGWIPLQWQGVYLPPLLAFLGAITTTLLVVLLSRKKGYFIPSQMLLAGLAFSSFSTALISLAAYLSDSNSQLRTIIFWTMGSFERATWSGVGLAALLLVIVSSVFTVISHRIHLLLLGEVRAYYMGIHVRLLRMLILLGVSLLTAAIIAYCGVIGFVGLVIPHFVRAINGAAKASNFALSVLIGATFMLACDVAARLIYPPAGLPVGIITALLGVPFFLYLLLKKNYYFE